MSFKESSLGSMNRGDRVLHIGDELTLLSEGKGLLFVDGLIKKKAFIMKEWNPRLGTNGDLMKCVFRVEPQLQFKNMRAFRSVVEHDVDGDLFHLNVLQRAHGARPGVDSTHVEELRQAAIAEQVANEAEFLRLKGKTVLYGSVIQLVNVHSKRYLSVNSRETCPNEPTSMAVELNRYLKRECCFRILPKFRIRAEGEPVRVGDAIVLKSVMTEGHLSVAKVPVMNEVLKHELQEAASSPYKHGWTIKLYRPSALTTWHNSTQIANQAQSTQLASANGNTNSRSVLGGRFVRLYHKEKEGYLMCPSVLELAINNYEEGGSFEQKVQLTEYKFDPLNPQDSTSCLILWQIENADSYHGENIEWNKPIRLRHGASNLYLSVSDENPTTTLAGHSGYIVDLKNNTAPLNSLVDSTLFVLVPVNQDGPKVSGSSYMRIRHLQTGAWLHVAETINFDKRGRQNSVPPSSGVPGLKVAAEKNLYHIIASKDPQLEDYFSISVADQDLVDKFVYVNSTIPWLLKVITRPRFKQDESVRFPFVPREAKTLTNLLTSFIYFCTRSVNLDPFKREGTPILLHQTILRETSVIEALIRFLEVSFQVPKRKYMRDAIEALLREAAGIDIAGELPKESQQIRISTEDMSTPASVQVGATISTPQISATSLLDAEATANGASLKAGEQPALSTVFRYIYRLLKQFLLGSDNDNQVHVSKDFDVLLSQLDLQVGAADTLMQLIAGNAAIVQSIGHSQIMYFVDLLARDRNPSYIKFLIALCQCDGVSIPSHQEFIAKSVLGRFSGTDNEEFPSHLFKLRLNTQGAGLEILPALTNGKRAWVPVADLFQGNAKLKPAASNSLRHRSNSSMKSPLPTFRPSQSSPLRMAEQFPGAAEYFEAMLRLYQALCFGQNVKVISLIVDTWKVISLKKCQAAFFDEGLPPDIRALFCDLIRVVFLDKFPISPSISDFVFPFNIIENRISLKLILNNAALDEETVDHATFLELSSWISGFLQAHTQMIYEDREINDLVLASLRLLKLLVYYGFIREEDQIVNLFQILTEILDGKSDIRDLDMLDRMKAGPDHDLMRDPWFTTDRFEMNENNEPIIWSKIEICAIMEHLLRLRLEVRVCLFLHYWHKYFRPGGIRSQSEETVTKDRDAAFGFASVESLVQTVIEETRYFKLNDNLSPICLDLLRYESPRLKKRSVRIIHRLHLSVEELMQMLQISLALNDPTHITLYEWMRKQIVAFVEGGVGSSSAVGVIDSSTIIGGLDSNRAEIYRKILGDFGQLCIAGATTTGPSDEDEVVPSPNSSDTAPADSINQWILRNLGVYHWVIAILRNRVVHAIAHTNRIVTERGTSLSRSSQRSRSQDSLRSGNSDLKTDNSDAASPSAINFHDALSLPIQSELLYSCFDFLYWYGNGCSEHQETIFNELDLLLESTHHSRSGCLSTVTAECVRQIGKLFSQNVAICLKITEDQIRRILHLCGGMRAEYLTFLSYFIKPCGKIIKKNQNLVMRLLLERRKQYANMDELLSQFSIDQADEDDDDPDEDSRAATKKVLERQVSSSGRSQSKRRRRLTHQFAAGSLLPSDAQHQSEFSMEYYVELISIMARCCEDSNAMLQSMGQTVLSVDQILSILKSDDAPLLLKTELLRFLVSVYITSPDDDETQVKIRANLEKDPRIWTFLDFTVRDLADKASQITKLGTTDPTSTFLQRGLLPFVINFFKRCCSSYRLSDNTHTDIAGELVDVLVTIVTDVRGSDETTSFLRRRLLIAIDSLKFAGFYGNRNDGDESKLMESLREIEVLDSALNTPKISRPTTPPNETNNDFEEDSMKVNQRLQSIVQVVAKDKATRKLQGDDFLDLAKKFDLQVEKQLTPFERKLVNAPTESLIQYLDHSVGVSTVVGNQYKIRKRGDRSKRKPEDNSAMDNFLGAQKDEIYDVKTVKVLERQVVKEILELEKIDRTTHPERWARRERRKIGVQNLLNELGCSLMAERLLTSDRPSVIAASLRLLIVLLDGGNKKVQETLENYWLGTREERFFYCMHERIKQSIIDFREARSLKADHSRKEDRNARLTESTAKTRNPRLATLARQGSDLSIGSSADSDKFSLRRSVTQTEDDFNSTFSLNGGSDRSRRTTSSTATQEDDPSIAGCGGKEDGEYSISRSIMRLLQLLVEGHNYRIQEYMRSQPDNIKTFDLVKSVVDFLHVVLPMANDQNMPLIVQVFDTLIDLSQGCTQNQVVIFNAKIIQPVNQILTEDFAQCNKDSIVRLRGQAMLCLLSLLEDDFDTDTRAVFKEMAISLDISTVVANLNATFGQVSKLGDIGVQLQSTHQQVSNEGDSKDSEDENEGLLNTGFLYSMLLQTLLPFMNDEDRTSCEENVAFNWFKAKTGHIEIVRELASTGEKRLFTVLFPIPSICQYIRDDTKARFLWMHKRDTPQDKIEDFINQSGDIIYEIKNQARVAGNKWLKLLAQGYGWWWWGAYIMTLLINLANMSCMIAPTGQAEHDDFSHCPKWIDIGRTFFGLIQVFFWGLSTAEFLIIQLPLLVNRKRIQRIVEEQERVRKLREKTGIIAIEGSEQKDEVAGIIDLQNEELSNRDVIFGFLEEKKALYHAAMVILAILGLRYPSLYAVHLLDYLYRDEVLQGVIASVTMNWGSLSKTVVLGVIIIYIYSMIGFIFFRHSFDEEQGLHCDSLAECFITTLSYGLRAGGGIGELLKVPIPESESYAARIVLDLSFFLIVIVFLLNVIFGIIFDTFGQLREERKDISDDLKNACFICSIGAGEFQREGKGFTRHVKEEHNIWHYLFFLIHLQLKDPTEFTSHESYVSELLSAQDLSFFPINRAMSLKNHDGDDELADRVRKLEEKVNLLIVNTAKQRDSIIHSIVATIKDVHGDNGEANATTNGMKATPVMMAATIGTRWKHHAAASNHSPDHGPL